MNKYALITGASRGIGRAIALEFAKNGKNVIILSSKSPKELETVKSEILTYDVDCKSFITDVSDYQNICSLKSSLYDLSIETDCIINNAGVSYFGLIQDMTPEEWNKTIHTNLSSVFYMTKQFIPDMIHSKNGCIINISSVWGNVGASCEAAYSASKGGINALTKSLAKELAPSGIRVNAIACGAIDTDMNNRLSDMEKRELENEIPVGRMGTPDEVAAFAYALYKTGNYITGQIITLDGGWT